ncbi:MAG: Ig-like domain-containing protein [Bacteroidetes bacterium]|nr:Ig-like domain-containing protein [Bacteroidota bacterium]
MKKLIYAILFLVGWSSTAKAGIFIENHSIYCGSILELGPVGYPSWVTATLIQAPTHGQVFIFDTPPFPDSLVYKSDYGYLGQDTFIIACAHATQITCDTGIYIISVIGCPPIQSFTETHDITCDSTLLIAGLGYPTWVTPEIVQSPVHGTAAIVLENSLWHTLQYTPMPGFNGTDTVVVECAHATQVTCETGIYIIHVLCLDATGEPMGNPYLQIFPNPAASRVVVQSAE